MTLDQLREALGHQNVKAFGRVVRQGESSQEEIAYRMRFPGKLFEGFDQHPQIMEPIPWKPGEQSSAAGAYQITWTTHRGLMRKYSLGPGFSPAEQDLLFVCLLDDCGALPYVLSGQFERAIHECVKGPVIWTSLPGGTENPQAMAKAKRVYEQYGGTYGEAPIEDKSTDLPVSEPTMPIQDVFQSVLKVAGTVDPKISILMGLANGIVNTFQPLAQEKLSQELGRHTNSPEIAGQMASNIMDTVKTVLKLPQNSSDIQAAAKYETEVAKNPGLARAVEEPTLKDLADMMPTIKALDELASQRLKDEDASRDAALGRGMRIQEGGPPWENPTFILAAFVLILVAYVVYRVLGEKAGFSTDMQAFVIGAVVGTAFTSVLSFFFGSSRSSGSKDAVISELSLRNTKE